jgi:hypothetical protein
MKAIKIVFEGETVGVLPAFNEGDTLSNLRDEISDDLGLKSFVYLYQDLPIELSKESILKVDCVAKQVSGENECLSIELTSGDQHPQGDRDSTKLKTNIGQTNMFLRRPSSWEVRGIKIYTAQDIEVAKGMEKQRRLFWNDTAKKLCKETKKPKQDIAQIINEAWRKEQTGLLIGESKDLLNAAEDMHAKESKLKPSTLSKNVQRIRNSQNELEKVNASIVETQKNSPGEANLKRKHELEELHRAKKYYLSDIKKGQDVMRKNLKPKNSDVKHLTE